MTADKKENKGPTTSELQRFIREKISLEFLLTNGDRLSGKLRWFDDQAFSVVPDGQQPITIVRSQVVAYRPQG